MVWCEANRVGFLFGLARNARLAGSCEAEAIGKPGRRFRDFTYATLNS